MSNLVFYDYVGESHRRAASHHGKELKLDPAIMAGPLITTVVDAVTLTIYFTIATWLLDI